MICIPKDYLATNFLKLIGCQILYRPCKQPFFPINELEWYKLSKWALKNSHSRKRVTFTRLTDNQMSTNLVYQRAWKEVSGTQNEGVWVELHGHGWTSQESNVTDTKKASKISKCKTNMHLRVVNWSVLKAKQEEQSLAGKSLASKFPLMSIGAKHQLRPNKTILPGKKSHNCVYLFTIIIMSYAMQCYAML